MRCCDDTLKPPGSCAASSHMMIWSTLFGNSLWFLPLSWLVPGQSRSDYMAVCFGTSLNGRNSVMAVLAQRSHRTFRPWCCPGGIALTRDPVFLEAATPGAGPFRFRLDQAMAAFCAWVCLPFFSPPV